MRVEKRSLYSIHIHSRCSNFLRSGFFELDKTDDSSEEAYGGGAVEVDVRVEDIVGGRIVEFGSCETGTQSCELCALLKG